MKVMWAMTPKVQPRNSTGKADDMKRQACAQQKKIINKNLNKSPRMKGKHWQTTYPTRSSIPKYLTNSNSSVTRMMIAYITKQART